MSDYKFYWLLVMFTVGSCIEGIRAEGITAHVTTTCAAKESP